MERSEPTLIPEWLKNAGSSNGGAATSPRFDNHSASHMARNKSFGSYNGNNAASDSPRSSNSGKTASSYFQRSSGINGAGKLRSYGSFGRNHRDRDRDSKDRYTSREKDKVGHLWDVPDTLVDLTLCNFERDGLRRSQSMISEKHGEAWPNKVVSDSKNEIGNNNSCNNTVVRKTASIIGVSKQHFERDFPSLSADGQTVASEIDRASSPGLGSAFQSLPIGTSVVLGGEKWTSSLAEVPAIADGNATSAFSVQQNASSSGLKSMATSLNMAEALVLGPNRAQTPPQLSVRTQRLEELAIKQSKQLIPMSPSLPKTLVSISSEKQKSKSSSLHIPGSSSLPLNQSPRCGPVKGDVAKAHDVAKLHVLKLGRERNGASPISKDNSSPKNGGKTVNPSLPSSPSFSVSAASAMALQVNSVVDRSKLLLEKRPTYQAKSRNDFFNSVRKQSMGKSSSPSNATSASSSEKFPEIGAEPTNGSPQPLDMSVDSNCIHGAQMNCNGDDTSYNDVQRHVNGGKENLCLDPKIPEEEEAAFLRSLGWEEDSDEGGLTEEEINAFYSDLNKYISSNTASLGILQGIQHKLLLPQVRGLSSSDAMES